MGEPSAPPTSERIAKAKQKQASLYLDSCGDSLPAIRYESTETEPIPRKVWNLERRPRILLGTTGSVASVKAPLLFEGLSKFADVKLVSTTSSLHFFSLPPEQQMHLFVDKDEWDAFAKLGDDVLHILLRKWADALVIAPLSANSLAKIANGMCDNLLTCVVRAWDFERPLIVAPAMNTLMWSSPFTERHLTTLKELNVCVIPPIAKVLACKDVGVGAMATVDSIIEHVKNALGINFTTISE